MFQVTFAAYVKFGHIPQDRTLLDGEEIRDSNYNYQGRVVTTIKNNYLKDNGA